MADQQQADGLRVIGAGLGRTSTTSLKTALGRLGFNAYHMDENFEHGHSATWKAMAEAAVFGDADAVTENYDAVAALMEENGYTATTDYPACLLYKHFMTRYPEAKVVLSVRSSPNAWAKSVASTIYRLCALGHRPPMSLFAPDMKALATWFMHSHDLLEVATSEGDEFTMTKVPPMEDLERAYTDWMDEVIATVPADRLLVHNAKDGYPPLCEFLGITECPDEPYPRANSGAELGPIVDAAELATDFFYPFQGLLLAAVLAGIFLRPIKSGRNVAVATVMLGVVAVVGFETVTSSLVAAAVVVLLLVTYASGKLLGPKWEKIKKKIN